MLRCVPFLWFVLCFDMLSFKFCLVKYGTLWWFDEKIFTIPNVSFIGILACLVVLGIFLFLEVILSFFAVKGWLRLVGSGS